ncbi:MAG: hypothetical protein JNM88_08525 [Chitinophagaceae bacterium]|nr:hypothetical protein [Chitinophagaceae bacterium]
MKKIMMTWALAFAATAVMAQDKEEKEGPSFKENLFTGGSVSLTFFNNTFLIGANPVFGYSVADWVDAGIVVNYTYTSYRDYNFILNDKLRQKVYGGGGFVKLYPVRFLFLQAQYEYNFIRQKYIQGGTGYTERAKGEAPSFLVGGGYTSGREGRGGEPFYYLAVLFDVNRNILSPYTDEYNNIIPIIRAGLQIPLFQGSEPRRRR